ncbi:MAG: ABC transporter permease [Mesorhizobium sp.]|uniref:ABC transporter permease n=1 Tax=Mesorhizobium sp. TaxID=1871066 RepID=UPI0011FF7460|nr:ABC transporter permease [Mesorhizobium sp.]TIP30747.1 MAG: ABC transporter permease [Mesorhizobium sp.]
MAATSYFGTETESVMSSAQLRAALKRSGRRRRFVSLSLFGPLLAFVLVFFFFPIVSFLGLAFQNGEVRSGLPLTSEALRDWDGNGVPQDAAFEALVIDLTDSSLHEAVTIAASRLNFDLTGFRSLIIKTAARLRDDQAAPQTAPNDVPEGFSIFGDSESNATSEAAPTPSTPKDRLISIDARWGETRYWAAIERGTWRLTPLYILAALDLRIDDSGSIEWAPADRQIYLDLIGRTFVVSAMVTLICVVLGFPVARFISTQPASRAGFFMFLVLVPLWTSILVRTTAWVVLLQGEGLLNDLIIELDLSETRLPLIHNRFGVYVAMVHICLPFVILPLYSVMKSTPMTYTRAAASLGASPLRVFLKIYLPLVFPGIAAGALLVFIMALGFYVTPALVGGPRDQMLSYFIAAAVNRDLNWGFAAALSIVLLLVVVVTMVVLRRFSATALAR